MSPELDALLCRRYPALFARRHLPPSVTMMGWGIACGDGWFDLIDDLCSGLQEAVEAGRITQPVAGQVKEKFGTLRFYLSGAEPEISRLVQEAERGSAVTCEICGRPGVLRQPGGVWTLCDLHGGDAPVVGDPTRSV